MPVIETRNVWFSYTRGEPVLQGIDFRAGPGEVVALAGPTGCGKSTFLLLLAGLLHPDQGEVLLDGRPLLKQMPAARKRIGMLFQPHQLQLQALFSLPHLSLHFPMFQNKLSDFSEYHSQ
ncbi:MAG TPA: ATP-binding cassette domain-containing protein [Pyrodictium sp.]|nr:ATP-binding cassette domain-containing protein [Pyrodictium sp.]